MSAATTAVTPESVTPDVIHSCPSCSHWLPDGTLACPDCQTLTYGRHLSDIASAAQQLEQQGEWQQARDRWQSTLPWLPAETQQAVSIQQHIAQLDARLGKEQTQKDRWTRRLGPFAPIAFFLLKVKSWLFLLFKVKFFFSLIGFFAIYWAVFGLKFAAGFSASILIHEMGHYVAIRRRGLKADLPVFFPGLGAYVRWYAQGVSREDLAKISLAGPVYGLGAALFCAAIFWRLHMPSFLMLANVGALINLFNLLPITFLGLDGAQATFALSRLQRILIASTCLLFFALTASTGLPQYVLLIVGLAMVWRSLAKDTPEKVTTAPFALFQALVLVLGFTLFRTAAVMASMPMFQGR